MYQEVVEGIEKIAREVLDGIHTIIPGTIQSFDPFTGVAAVKPDGSYNTPSGKKIPYPVLSDVPVMIPCFKEVEIAIPIKENIGCLLLCMEQSDSGLKYDLTNAVAVLGTMKIASAALVKACKSNSVIITNKDTELMISSDSISIKGNLNIDGNITYTGRITGPGLDK